MVEINDEAGLERWLDTAPIGVCSAMAARVALRVLPVAHSDPKPNSNSTLLILRSCLVASVISVSSSEQLKKAAKEAYLRTNEVALDDNTNGGLYFGGLSAATAASVGAELQQGWEQRQASFSWLYAKAVFSFDEPVMPEVFFDASQFSTTDANLQLLRLPLFSGTRHPSELKTSLIELAEFFDAEPDVWSFWKRWYLAMLNGTWRDWDLARDVALIPDDVWEKGAAAVAVEIAKLEAAHLTKRLPLAETLVFDDDSRVGFAPITLQKLDLMSVILDRVDDLLEDAQANPSNGLNERSIEVRTLTRTISRYGNNPQRIEMDFVQVHAGLTRQIATQELPVSEENTALRDALEEGARAIRATHPEVSDNREILKGAAFAELSAEDAAILETAEPILAAISDETTAEDWHADLPAIRATRDAPPSTSTELGGADRNPGLATAEKTRVFSRAAKIALAAWRDSTRAEKISALAIGCTVSGVTVMSVLESIVALGAKLMIIF